MSARETQPVPRIALTPTEAAAALGVSRDWFDKHVKPELRVIARGSSQRGGRRVVLVPVQELERWARENACAVLD